MDNQNILPNSSGRNENHNKAHKTQKIGASLVCGGVRSDENNKVSSLSA
jgi:hypothetical protein